MADDARLARDDLTRLPPDEVPPDATPPDEATEFFELLRRLERGGEWFGRSGGPGREPARLGQSARLSAATRDVARLTPQRGDAPRRIEVEVIGLLGPEGPMPLHLTRRVFDRVSQRWFEAGSEHATADTSALDFCNMLQHRMIALYWRAWGDARPSVHAGRPGAGRVGATLAALAGVGLPGMRGEKRGNSPSATAEPVKLNRAMQIAQQVHGPERLAAPVADLLGAPVRVVEFVANWIDIPAPLQTRLGQAHARLGGGAVAGARIFSRQDRAELRVGPVDLPAYRRLADDAPLRGALRHLVLHLVGREIDIDLRPVLAADAVPPPLLGRVALGRTAWLRAAHPADRDDLRLPRITREAA
ncbi:type VI secretion system baseplate subunit TssG [Paracoccus sp. Z118]|uniref:type VI secretion system baseplate subunit TssG n=1 Tax=Paracoccus sp. Z118 TaxID=2851017 RepID=UPI001C2C7F40|nr:type VI secretion system baseplate subunit TssG [Paracoccus sp. Z118]MBV0890894.1 type VI secretion system baseplate subunit TssG [Paracoccus sp. Z118]